MPALPLAAPPAALGTPSPGFFGKVPARGDFLMQGLPQGFVQAWDAWLSAALTDGEARLGARWRSAFIEAPVWRFVLGAGWALPSGGCGLLVPSADSAGRCFPLTVFCPWAAADGAADWFARTEEALSGALAAMADPASLLAALAAVPPPRLPAPLASMASAWQPLAARAGLDPAAGAAVPPGWSLWWTVETEAPQSYLCEGLPPSTVFPEFLRPECLRPAAGWSDWRIASAAAGDAARALQRADLGLWAVAAGPSAPQVIARLDAMPPPDSAPSLLNGVAHALLEGVGGAGSAAALLVAGDHFACVWLGDILVVRSAGGSPERLTHGGAGGMDADAGRPDGPLLNLARGRLAAGDRFLLCDAPCAALSDDLVSGLAGLEPEAALAALGDAGGAAAVVSIMEDPCPSPQPA